MRHTPIRTSFAFLASLARGARAAAVALAVLATGLAAAQGVGQLDSVVVARAKLSPDLLQAVDTRLPTTAPWVKDAPTGRLVKVLVMGDKAAASDLRDLRRDILAAGGSVYYRYISLTGVSAMLPANKVIELARRKDVVRMVPNRPASPTASTHSA